MFAAEEHLRVVVPSISRTAEYNWSCGSSLVANS